MIPQVLAGPVELEPLPDDIAVELVASLKAEADRHYWIDANHSLALADRIIAIGQARADASQIALGMLTRADSLRFLGRSVAAWDLFDVAGELFRERGDEVGWARSRIGRLLCCVELNRVAEALADARQAENIFMRHGEHERLLALYNNTAMVHDLLGQYRQALALYERALALAASLGERGRHHRGLLLLDQGCAYFMLGDLHRAGEAFVAAQHSFAERDETRGVALAQQNLGHIALLQGQHRRALQLLYAARDAYLERQLTLDATHVNRDIVECYVLLNRFAEARDLAAEVVATYQGLDERYRAGLALLHLATAEAELGNIGAAEHALRTVEPIFAALGVDTWMATATLRRGQLALRAGDPALAAREALAAAACFTAHDQQVEAATATLLHGQASFMAGDAARALQDGRRALRSARATNVPPLRYAAHLLLGRLAERRGDLVHARRRYAAAVATVERVQRSLTITLRPGFLADKDAALRHLLGLQLRGGDHPRAFETLERAKSQALMSYLTEREQLRWSQHDPRSRALLAELNQLRDEHQWFYRLAHDIQDAPEDDRRPAIAAEAARAEVASRERRMRAITEQLYLIGSGAGVSSQITVPQLADVQRSLDAESVLLEFYDDGAQLWCFSIDADSIAVHALPLPVAELHRLLAQLQVNIAAALATDKPTVAQHLAKLAQRMLARLYQGLLAPLAERLHERQRLVIVPYGALHYLPFHLLHTGAGYLVEQHEVVILPAAALATRRGPQRTGGARTLAHSWSGRLPETVAEAGAVQAIFGGEAYHEDAVRRTVLSAPPTQILHIAAHGEQRPDQPDLSYIQFADGQLYTDDLLQHDLSYELVTLSACETGRAHVAPGDELIGLGRGFLYAGAGALIVSLWRVADAAALGLMREVYAQLSQGASKAAALRAAQLTLLHAAPELHPAIWGAFQLIGDAAPLAAARALGAPAR